MHREFQMHHTHHVLDLYLNHIDLHHRPLLPPVLLYHPNELQTNNHHQFRFLLQVSYMGTGLQLVDQE